MLVAVVSALGAMVMLAFIVRYERRHPIPAGGDWLTARSPFEAGARLIALASFYTAFLLILLAPSKETKGRIRELVDPWGPIVLLVVLAVFAAIGLLMLSAYRRRPDDAPRMMWSGRVFQTPLEIFLPARLAESSRIVGIPPVLTYVILSALLLAGLGVWIVSFAE